MKEIMIPYILICWLLLKFRIVAASTRNYSIMVGLGIFIALSLFTAHRYFSPADLTLSTTVTAPRSVLSPAIGQEIDQIFVAHNEKVKKGTLLYTLTSYTLTGKALEANEALKAAELEMEQARREMLRKQRIGAKLISRNEIELAEDRYETAQARFNAEKTRLQTSEMDVDQLTIHAPYDGQVSHIYIDQGSRVGALHLWNTNQKFIIMRIPDQAYGFIEPGQFAEFYVDAYPGHIFRARVHSITGATGESAGTLLPRESMVGQQIRLGALPVGRTVILEFEDPEGYDIPIGATGSAWISASKPKIFSFMDVIGAATVRLYAAKAYLGAF